MAYSNKSAASGMMDDSEMMDDSGETPPETSKPTSGKTFFIPPEYQDDAIANAKPGDIVKIRIVGKDADGAVEAECDNEKTEEDDWKGSLDNAMPESFGGKKKEMM